MRIVFLLFALALSACAPQPTKTTAEAPPAPREISGVLAGKTELSGEIVIAGDLLVPAGSALIIHPGTVLRVRASESTKIDPEYLSSATEILVRGTVTVLGTSERPVRFLPLDGAPGGDPAWAGIVLDRSEKSLLQHLEVQGAETGLLCIGTSPDVHFMEIVGCRYGLVAQDGSAPHVTDSRIEHGEGGVFCWREARPTVRRTRIAGNAEEGVFIDPSSAPVLEGNEITGNGIGLVFTPGKVYIDLDQVRENVENVRVLGRGLP